MSILWVADVGETFSDPSSTHTFGEAQEKTSLFLGTRLKNRVFYFKFTLVFLLGKWDDVKPTKSTGTHQLEATEVLGRSSPCGYPVQGWVFCFSLDVTNPSALREMNPRKGEEAKKKFISVGMISWTCQRSPRNVASSTAARSGSPPMLWMSLRDPVPQFPCL